MTHPTPQGNEETVEARAVDQVEAMEVLGEALFALSGKLRISGFFEQDGNAATYEKAVAAFQRADAAALAPPIREHGEGVRERVTGIVRTAMQRDSAYHRQRISAEAADEILAALSAQPVKDAVLEAEWEGPLTDEEVAMIDGAWERHKAAAPCLRPPQGWLCSRSPGHKGPCAARPMQTLSPKTPASVGLDPAKALRAALPEKIGRLSLGERLSEEHYCGGSHDMPDGQPIYWQERGGEYPDDIDGYCLTCAIEQAESDSGWCECSIKAALTPEDRP
jgi:hypothetical protein